MIRRTEKLQWKFLGMAVDRFRRRILLESLLENPFDSVHVQQLETERAAAGLVEAFGSVAFRQA